MAVKDFINSCEIELQGLKSGDVQHVRDAIENLTCIPDVDLKGEASLQIEIRRRFNRAFLEIVGCSRLNPKAWDAFTNMNFEPRHIRHAVTAYNTALALI